MVVLFQELGDEENVNHHVTPNTGSNNKMQILGAFLLNYITNAIGMGGWTEYAEIWWTGMVALRGVGGKRSSCNLPSQCCLFSCSSQH
jgi:hypothetical protein